MHKNTLPKIFRPRILSLLAAVLISACDSETNTQTNPVNPADVLPATSAISFQPSAGIISVPNDLLFSGTVDGTLEIPDEVAARATGGADYSDPSIAIGALDGWSTQMPFVLNIDFAEGATLDATTLPNNVRIFETLTSDGQNCGGSATLVPAGLPCAPVSELSFATDFVVQASTSGISVVPLQPLKPATTYVLVLLDGIADSNARNVEASATYQILVDPDVTITADQNETLASLQSAVGLYNTLAQAASGGTINSDAIIFSQAFTTQSAGLGTEFAVLKTLMASAALPTIALTPTGVTVATALGQGAPFDAADLYSGSITLPYYLTPSTTADPTAAFDNPWQALCDNGLASAQLAGATPPPEKVASDAVCQTFGLRDIGVDMDRHITRFNPLPANTGNQVLDVQVTVPNALSGMSEPASGWPLAILQHGITSRKEDMLAMTGALSLAGIATIAIDLPLHGSRGFDINGDDVDEVNASTISATHYMNLENLLVARDNLRQSIADMLGLRLGINAISGINVDLSRIHVVGLSLGAISSTSFTSQANSSVASIVGAAAAGIDPLYTIQSASLHSPGGGIAALLLESASFAPLIRGSVVLGSGTALATSFASFNNSPDQSCASLDPSSQLFIACQYVAFEQSLVTAGDTESLNALNLIIQSFAFAAQTLIDSGDPNNFAAAYVATATPTLATIIVGDSADNLPDQVIPNQTVNLPFGGGEPIVQLLGLSGLAANDSATSGVVRFTAGSHASVINPATDAAVTNELQMETAGFIATGSIAVSAGAAGFVAAP